MKKSGLTIVLILCLVFTLFGCEKTEPEPQASQDEIMLKIKLYTQEDIGLFIVDYDADGFDGSGGTSNADKSLLKHDELIIYTLDKEYFDGSLDTKHLTLQFTIITEYCDPNYENIYPEEYTKVLEPITFDADFGESYSITITGDKTNGYTAILNQ